MFIVYADRPGRGQDPTRREGFETESYSHALSEDASSGWVTLTPGGRVLRVATDVDGYERIRVFSQRGELVGAMTRTPHGRVVWSVPMWTEDRPQVRQPS